MNKAFVAGLVIGFIIGYAMRQEKVSTVFNPPAGGGANLDWNNIWWEVTN